MGRGRYKQMTRRRRLLGNLARHIYHLDIMRKDENAIFFSFIKTLGRMVNSSI